MKELKLYDINGTGRFREDEFSEEEIILWKFFDEMFKNDYNTWNEFHNLCCDCVPTYTPQRRFDEIAEALYKLQAFCEEIYIPGLDVFLNEIELYEIFRFIESDLYTTYLEKKKEAEEEK